MTSSYGSLLAQVVPVVLLALILELRYLLNSKESGNKTQEVLAIRKPTLFLLYALVALLLSREEFVALVAANGAHVPRFEVIISYLAIYWGVGMVILLALVIEVPKVLRRNKPGKFVANLVIAFTVLVIYLGPLPYLLLP